MKDFGLSCSSLVINGFEVRRLERFERLELLEPRLLKPQRAAAFARIGPTDEGAGLWVNHNHMCAAEAFGIAADDFMPSTR